MWQKPEKGRPEGRPCRLSKNLFVGVGVPDDPSEKSDLDGPIFPHTELPPDGGRDVEDAIPYGFPIEVPKKGGPRAALAGVMGNQGMVTRVLEKAQSPMVTPSAKVTFSRAEQP